MLSDTNVKQWTCFLKTPWVAVLLLTGMSLAVGGIAAVLPLKAVVVIFAFPLFAGFLFLAVTRFEQAVLIAIFFTPLLPTSVGLRLSDSLPLITGQRVMLATLYLAFVLRGVSNKVRLQRFSSLTQLILLVYIGSSIASSLFSTLPLQSFYRVLANLFDNVGLFIIVASAAMGQKDNSFVRKALSTLWASFMVLAVLGLVDTLTGFNPLYYLLAAQGDVLKPVYRLGIRRAQGLLPNPTALGVVMALGIVLTITVMMWQKNSLKRKSFWWLELVNIAALIGTLTRTAWVLALVGIGIWLFSIKKNRTQLILLIIVISTILLILGVGSTLYSIVLAGMDLSQQTEVSTLLSRVRWIDIVWAKINVSGIRFLFGFGPGAVEYLTLQWGVPGFRALMTSDYLIRLAEGGILGLLSFVGVLFVSIRQCRRLIRSSDLEMHTLGVLFAIVFIQMALSSTTLPIFVWAQTAYLFWIFWGILVTIHSPMDAHVRKTQATSRSVLLTS